MFIAFSEWKILKEGFLICFTIWVSSRKHSQETVFIRLYNETLCRMFISRFRVQQIRVNSVL